MTVEIIPSVLSADFARLAHDVESVAAAGVTKVQVDVMDGQFVPNITVGVPVVRALEKATDVALDVHLMIDRPERYVDAFVAAGADVVTVHAEATHHLHRVISRVLDLGAQAGVAINPATPVETIAEVLYMVDVALVMTVNPGFGGQRFIPAMTHKVRRVAEMIHAQRLHAAVQVDGGIDVDTAPLVVAAGAAQLVAGTSVFAAGVPVADALDALRASARTALD